MIKLAHHIQLPRGRTLHSYGDDEHPLTVRRQAGKKVFRLVLLQGGLASKRKERRTRA